MAVFKRKGKNGREIPYWYFRFYVGKKEYCNSSGTTNKLEAKRIMLLIEKTFGTQLREHAVRISKERWAKRQDVLKGKV